MPTRDERIGLPQTTINGVNMTSFNPKIAIRIVDKLAEGQTLKDICKAEDMPSRSTVYRWVAIYPEFAKILNAAKELSAQSLEEEALDMARVLKNPNDFTSVKVKSYEVAMAQFRWSAAHRDPKRFGQTASTSPVVPIQINTTLDLGDGKVTQTAVTDDSIYTLQASVKSIEDKNDIREQQLEAIIEDLDPADDPYKLPEKMPPSKFAALKPPRKYRHPKHKSEALTKRAQTLYEKKKARQEQEKPE